MFWWKLLCICFCILPLVLLVDTTKKGLASLSRHLPFRFWQTFMESLFSHLFPGLNRHNSLSLFSCQCCSTPLIIHVALVWITPGTPSLCCAEEPRTGQSIPDGSLTRAQWLGRISSLALMYPRILLAFLATMTHCGPMDILLSTRAPRSFSTELLPIRSALSLY